MRGELSFARMRKGADLELPPHYTWQVTLAHLRLEDEGLQVPLETGSGKDAPSPVGTVIEPGKVIYRPQPVLAQGLDRGQIQSKDLQSVPEGALRQAIGAEDAFIALAIRTVWKLAQVR
jgi:hypothetical protein